MSKKSTSDPRPKSEVGPMSKSNIWRKVKIRGRLPMKLERRRWKYITTSFQPVTCRSLWTPFVPNAQKSATVNSGATLESSGRPQWIVVRQLNTDVSFSFVKFTFIFSLFVLRAGVICERKRMRGAIECQWAFSWCSLSYSAAWVHSHRSKWN